MNIIILKQALAVLFILNCYITNVKSQFDPLSLLIGANGEPNEIILQVAQTFTKSYFKTEFKKVWQAMSALQNDTSGQFDKTQCFNQFVHMFERIQERDLWAVRGESLITGNIATAIDLFLFFIF